MSLPKTSVALLHSENPAASATGSISTPNAASFYAAAPAGDNTALSVKTELSSEASSTLPPLLSMPASTLAPNSDSSVLSSPSHIEADDCDKGKIHFELYFSLKATVPPSVSNYKFAHASKLCPPLLAQLASSPSLSATGLFVADGITLIISKHSMTAARTFIYTASFILPKGSTHPASSEKNIAEMILSAQNDVEVDHKSSSALKGFKFELPFSSPEGHNMTSTRVTFAYNREDLLGYTTIDFQVKIPTSFSQAPHEEFSLLVVQLYTPRGSLTDTEFLTLTKTDRDRFSAFCVPRQSVSTKHGNWLDEAMTGTLSLNFEDAESRDCLIWNFLIFATIFGLDPRFGNHQQYQLYIPVIHDQRQLDKRPLPMRQAVKMFKENLSLAALMPSKPLRSRPKPTEASSSESECEIILLGNIARRSEALSLLRVVTPHHLMSPSEYLHLRNIPFTPVINIPHVSIAPIDEQPSHAAPPPVKSQTMCESFLKGTCSNGDICSFTHDAPVIVNSSGNRQLNMANVQSRPPLEKEMSQKTHTAERSKLISHASSSTARTVEFVGEGKKDTPCLKFLSNSCSRGKFCKYSHDIRDGLASNSLSIVSPVALSKQASRMHPATPVRGAAHFNAFMNAIETIAALRPAASPEARNLLQLNTSSLNSISAPLTYGLYSSLSLLSSVPVTPFFAPQFSALNALALEAMPQVASPKKAQRRPDIIVERLSRSQPSQPIASLLGWCVSGHRIFKRSSYRQGSTMSCSFCKQDKAEVFTCTCASSHCCMQCLTERKSAPPPPCCPIASCGDLCSIRSLTRVSLCCNMVHQIPKNHGAWHCHSCKHIMCRSCALIQAVSAALLASKTPSHIDSEASSLSSLPPMAPASDTTVSVASTALSATVSASML
jgi:hypothetical protein